MGRKRDELVWKYAEGLKKNRFRCKFCELSLSGGASRIKAHLAKVKCEGIKICTKVTTEVQAEIRGAIKRSNKRPKGISTSSNDGELMEENLLMKEKNKGLYTHNPVGPSERKGNMGRKRDESAWKYVEGLKKNRFRCKFCELDLSGGASRIKAHLGKFKREGIKICTKVTKEVQAEICGAINRSNKRHKGISTSGNDVELQRQMEENTPMKEKNKDLIMQRDFFFNFCTPSEPHTSPLVEDLHDVHLEYIDFDPNLAANMEDLGIQNHNLDGNFDDFLGFSNHFDSDME